MNKEFNLIIIQSSFYQTSQTLSLCNNLQGRKNECKVHLTFVITGGLDFPPPGILKNTTFRKLELFPSSGEEVGDT
jgi:hypothetical protein